MLFRRKNKIAVYAPTLVLEQLEDRIVLDATVDAGGEGQDQQDQKDQLNTDPMTPDAAGSDNAAADAARPPEPIQDVLGQDLNVVLISNSLDQVDALSQAAAKDAQVIVYDSDKTDLDAINTMLGDLVQSQGHKIGHLALLTHGDPGKLDLSSVEVFTAASMESNQQEWQTLGSLLAQDARIDLYGCNIGEGPKGMELVSAMAHATGATVWASDDATGTVQWADMDLEVHSGESNLGYLIDASALEGTLIYLDNDDMANPGFESGGLAPEWVVDNGPALLLHADADTHGGVSTGNTPYAATGEYILRLDDSTWDTGYAQIHQAFQVVSGDDIVFAYNFVTTDWGNDDTFGYRFIGSSSGVIAELVMDAGDVRAFGSSTGWQEVSLAADHGVDMTNYIGETVTVELWAGNTGGSGSPSWGYFDFNDWDGNHWPTNTGQPNITVPMGTDNSQVDLWALFQDTEDYDAQLTYTVEEVSNPAIFDATLIDASDGFLNLDYAAGTFGASTIRVRATDTGGHWSDAVFTVTIYPQGNQDMTNPGFDLVADPFAGWSEVPGYPTHHIVSAAGETHGSDTDPDQQYTTPASPFGSEGNMVRLDQFTPDNPEARITQTWTYDGDPYVVFAYNWVTLDDQTPYDDFGYRIQVNGTTRLFYDVDSSAFGTGLGPPIAATGWQTIVFDLSPYLTGGADTIRLDLWAGNSGDNLYPSWGYVDLYHHDAKPTTTGLSDVTVFEDAPDTVINLQDHFSDAETPSTDLVYSILSNTNSSIVSASIAGGILTLDYVDNAYGTSDLVIQAMDEQGQTVNTSFSVKVLPVVDLPTVVDQSVTVDEDSTVTITVTGYDADAHDVSEVSFDVVDGVDHGTLTPVAGTLTHDGNGTYTQQYTYTPDQDYYGPDEFRFVLITPSGDWNGFDSGGGIGDSAASQDTSGATMSIAAGDMDGDGYQDIVAVNYGGENRFHSNDGTGAFPTGVSFGPANSDSTHVAVGDMDGDGDLDVVVANDGSLMKLYLNDGSANFQEAIVKGGPTGQVYGITLADVDNDTDLDIIVADRNPNSGADHRIMVFYNDGLRSDGWGGLQLKHDTETIPDGSWTGAAYRGSTNSVVAGDIDGDGSDDVVAGKYLDTYSDYLYINDTTGIFSTSAEHALPGSGDYTWSVKMADINNDGALDIVVGNGGDSSAAANLVYFNDGSGGFSAADVETIGATAFHTHDVVVGDIDNDGDFDVVAADGAGEPNQYYINGFVESGGTSAVFDAGTVVGDAAKGYTSTSAALVDVDNDGDQDLVFGNWNAQNTVHYNLGFADIPSAPGTVSITVNGGYDLPISDSGSIWVPRGGSLTFQVYGYDPDRHDVNEVKFYVDPDYEPKHGTLTAVGDPIDLGNGYFAQTFTYDLSSDPTYWGEDSFEFNLVTESGTWSGFVSDDGLPIGAASDAYNTRDMVLVDVDGDGRLDFLVTANSEDGAGEPNMVYAINPDGTFEAGQALTNASGVDDLQSYHVVSGDLNGDGYADLVIGNVDANDTIYFWNQTTGFFDPGIDLPNTAPNNDTGAVAVGDVDRDHDLDIVVGNDGSDVVYHNNGDGTFDTGYTIPNSSNRVTNAVALADVNGDGWLDYLAGKWNDELRVHWNDGNGEFSTYNEQGWRRYASEVAVGDADRDGDTDIVMSSYSTNDPRGRDMYFRNNGTSSFDRVYIERPLHELSASIELQDVNRDGFLDAVITVEGKPDRYYLFNPSTNDFDSGIAFGTGADTDTYGGVVGDVDGDGDLDYIAGFLGAQNRIYENLGFAPGNLEPRFGDPGKISIHIGVLQNPDFDYNYDAWKLNEFAYSNDGTFAIVQNGQTIELWDPVVSNALYDFYKGEMQEQFAYPPILPLTIQGGDDHISLQMMNSPRHGWMTQEFFVPYDGSVQAVELHWSMAYWNFHTSFDDGWQHVALYVHDADDNQPDPVWISTNGVDDLKVPEMKDYWVRIPVNDVVYDDPNSTFSGNTVRISFEVTSLWQFLFAAVDDFRIVPIRGAVALDQPTLTPAPELGPVLNPLGPTPPYYASGTPKPTPVPIVSPFADTQLLATGSQVDSTPTAGLTSGTDASLVSVLENLSTTQAPVTSSTGVTTQTATVAPTTTTASATSGSPTATTPTSGTDATAVDTAPADTTAAQPQTSTPTTQTAPDTGAAPAPAPADAAPAADPQAVPAPQPATTAPVALNFGADNAVVFDLADLSPMRVLEHPDNDGAVLADAGPDRPMERLGSAGSVAFDMDSIRFTDLV